MYLVQSAGKHVQARQGWFWFHVASDWMSMRCIAMQKQSEERSARSLKIECKLLEPCESLTK